MFAEGKNVMGCIVCHSLLDRPPSPSYLLLPFSTPSFYFLLIYLTNFPLVPTSLYLSLSHTHCFLFLYLISYFSFLLTLCIFLLFFSLTFFLFSIFHCLFVFACFPLSLSLFFPVCVFLSLFFPVCVFLSLFFPVCVFLSLFFLVCVFLSLFFPICVCLLSFFLCLPLSLYLFSLLVCPSLSAFHSLSVSVYHSSCFFHFFFSFSLCFSITLIDFRPLTLHLSFCLPFSSI
ncbi:unnamed protein product [Acanthosepion pharaonis]|uniref:Uncharacterized protein n=1 Tax=Acanthosepion pharaonis TaxID=158019 RepID=A0A812DJU9_ACAPH|nr:unnamed protein product [Sepia pharaonis]